MTSAVASTPTLRVVRSIGNYEAVTVDSLGNVYAVYGAVNDTARTKVFRSSDEMATTPSLAHDFGTRTTLMSAMPNGTLFTDVRDGLLGNDGIQRSDDHGATWTRVCLQAAGSSVCDNWLPSWPGVCGQTSYNSQLLTQDNIVSDGRFLYLGTYNNSTCLAGNTNQIYRSADDGRTWQVVHQDTLHRHIHGLQVAPAGRLIVFIGDSNVADGVWYSDDQGVTLKPLVSNRAGDQYNVMIEAGVSDQGHLVGGTDIPYGNDAIVDVDPATGDFKVLEQVPYESFCSRALPDRSAVIVGSVYEPDGGVKWGDPNLHLYAVVGGATYDVYQAPIPNTTAWGFLCPVGVFPNGDVAVYRSGYGTIIVHLSGVTSPPPPTPTPVANTAAPIVSGTAQVGQSLNLAVGVWTGSPTPIVTDQWQRCSSTCTDIFGATASSYTLAAADLGATIQVKVTGSNSAGPSLTVTSNSVGPVEIAPPPPPIANLAPDPDFESDPDPSGSYSKSTYPSSPTGVTFSWATDAARSGSHSLKIATASGYTGILSRWSLNQGATAGKTYNVSLWIKTANATGSEAFVDVRFFDASSVNTASSYSSTVSGTTDWTKVSVSATAPAGTTRIIVEFRLDGLGTAWADDVSLTDGSAPPPPPLPATLPSNSAPPGVFGTPQVTQTLTTTNGTWTGTQPINYSYQWQRCNPACSDVSGATTSSYTLVAADQGANIQVKVTASNSAGSAPAVASNAVGPVQSPPPIANLAPDPDFESDPSGSYTASVYPTTSTPFPAFSWATDAAHSGAHSLKIATTSGYNGLLSRWTVVVTGVTPGKTYAVSLWIKTANASGQGAMVTLRFFDASGSLVSLNSPTVSGTSDWTQVSVTGTAPTGTTRIYSEFMLYGPGTAWVDDVVLRQQ